MSRGREGASFRSVGQDGGRCPATCEAVVDALRHLDKSNPLGARKRTCLQQSRSLPDPVSPTVFPGTRPGSAVYAGNTTLSWGALEPFDRQCTARSRASGGNQSRRRGHLEPRSTNLIRIYGGGDADQLPKTRGELGTGTQELSRVDECRLSLVSRSQGIREAERAGSWWMARRPKTQMMIGPVDPDYRRDRPAAPNCR